jgi:hypothetical protein
MFNTEFANGFKWEEPTMLDKHVWALNRRTAVMINLMFFLGDTGDN